MPSAADASEVTLLELLGVLSLATDLGTGQPQFHGLRSSVLAVGLARQLGLAPAALEEVQQVALLRFLGCTADSAETARMTGGDDLAFVAAMAPVVMGRPSEIGRRMATSVGAGRPTVRRAALVAQALADPGGARRSLSAHCEVAAMLAERLGSEAGVRHALAHAYERWDGAGFPDGLAGPAVPLPVRITVVARDADLWWRAGAAAMTDVLGARRGRSYDPAVVDACLTVGPALLAELDTTDTWSAAMSATPGRAVASAEDMDRALAAVADFADLKSPWTRGHSPRVADLAAAAGLELGLPAEEVVRLRQAALLHDLGRVGVPNGIWDRPGPLGVAERQRARQHSYLTEVTLGCCPGLAELGEIAGGHHERMDGSGYHRGTRRQELPVALLAVADSVAAMAAPRPYRAAAAPARIADEVRAEVAAGRLDGVAADGVLAAAGQRRPAPRHSSWPAGLSDREVEVLRLIARGCTNKQVAARLSLSVKTVGRHVENVYAKAGVNSRAAAAVFAMGHRLLEP